MGEVPPVGAVCWVLDFFLREAPPVAMFLISVLSGTSLSVGFLAYFLGEAPCVRYLIFCLGFGLPVGRRFLQ